MAMLIRLHAFQEIDQLLFSLRCIVKCASTFQLDTFVNCRPLNISSFILFPSPPDPVQIVESPHDRVVREGVSDVEFKCKARGTPRPTITWLFNGSAIQGEEGGEEEG